MKARRHRLREELAERSRDGSIVEWHRRSEIINELRGRVFGTGRVTSAVMQLTEWFQLRHKQENISNRTLLITHKHTHTRLTALSPGLPGWAGTRKVKSIWILLKQETASGSGISWAMQVCTALQTDNHASTPPLSFLQAGCPSCCPTNSVKALKLLTTNLN